MTALILIGLGASYFKKAIDRTRLGTIPLPIDKQNRLPSTKKLININTAGFQDLTTLKGIGVKTAQRIIEYRNSNGPFFYIEDIKKIKGIGPKKFEAIKKWITTD